MSQRVERSAMVAMVKSLGWPLLLGAASTSLFYVLVFRGPLDLPFFHRYCAGHPVLFAEVGLFFVGAAALLLKLLEVASQYWSVNAVQLEPPPPSGQSVDDVPRLLEGLGRLPEWARQSYLGRRLRDALQFVQRQGSTEGLNDELKYLSDLDAARQQESFGLVRIVIWATPMLGFLGTVVGITQALGDLDPQQLATNIQVAMEGLLAGLYVAFDTTALALSLSMGLMFVQFLIDRTETQVLSTVDLRANETLAGRFEQVGGSHDPYLNSIGRMSQQVVQATEELVRQQAALWRSSLDAAHQQWAQLFQASAGQMQAALGGALEQALAHYAAEIAKGEREASDRARHRWEQLQTAISDNARVMQAQQKELIRQGEVMSQAIQAAGQVITLEKSLNENLKALAGAKNFEDTVMSLTAAIHLMSTRLGAPAGETPRVDLKPSSSRGRAA